MSLHNPIIYDSIELLTMSDKDILIAQYQLQYAFVSLFFATTVVIFVVLSIRWILPKYWYKSKES